jgi:TetR/AcrR family fatty acid metabolism transcriptional regulator
MSTPSLDPIQAQLIAARRTQILDAAAKVFAAKGFHPTTIKDIAKEAGIADGTIYHYFESKGALLLGIFDHMRLAVTREVNFTTLDPDDLRGFLHAFISQPLQALHADNSELFRIILAEMMVNRDLRERYYQQMLDPMLALAEPIFARWVLQGRIEPLDLRLTLRAISGVIFGIILESIMGDQTLETRWDELPDFLTDLILHGLGSNQV